MRILAIRGANLASLEAPFEVDLSSGPLERAGVFAICGPTGAGKSTLLDAMCLALFDTAPRLEGRGRGRVGRKSEAAQDRLTIQDPRTLLRQGAVEGWAEVDFEGVDGRHYMARWEVRRARGRPGGKLQASRMSIRDLASGWKEGGRKTDVRLEIERRLGLRFDQFRRSVLLAQGDFAAFLDADPRARAELLERMTGTEIYGLISQETHARVVEERRALERVADRMNDLGSLSDEERAALDGRVAGLAFGLREVEARLEEITRAVRWYAVRSELQGEEREALAALSELSSQLEAAEPRRALLASVDRVTPLRSLWVEEEGARRALVLREGAMSDLEAQANATARSVEEAESAREKARAEREAAEALSERCRADLERGRALERALAEARAAARSHAARQAEREAERGRLEERRAALRLRAEEAEAASKEASEWFAAREGIEELTRDWDRIASELQAWTQLSERHRGVVSRSAEAKVDVASRGAESETAAAAEVEARTRRDQAEAEWRVAAEASRGAPAAELEEERARLVTEAAGLERVGGCAAQLRRLEREEEGRLASLGRIEARIEEAAGRAEAASVHAARLALREDEARRMYELLRARADLASHRSALVAGEPCPLCGAEEHPSAEEEGAVEEVLAEARARVDTLIAERTEHERRTAEARGEHEAESAAGERVRAEIAETGVERERMEGELRSSLDGVGETLRAQLCDVLENAAEGSVDGLEAKLSAARVALEGRLASVKVELDQRRAAERAVLSARERLDAARTEAEAALERRTAVSSAHASSVAALEALEVELAGLDERIERARSALGPLLALVGADSEGSPSQVHDRLEAEVELGREQRRRQVEAAQALEEIGEERGPLEVELAGLLASLRAVEERRVETEKSIATRSEELVSVLSALAEALGDTAPDAPSVRGAEGEEGSEIERHAERALALVALARETFELAVARATAALEDRARAATALDGGRKSLSSARADAERASADFERAFSELGLEEAEARRLLTYDLDEVEGWRRELTRLDQERQRHETVVKERSRRLQAHEAAGRPAATDAEATALHGRTRTRLDAMRERLHVARGERERDDASRAARAELTRSHEGQLAKLEVWEALAELIGSASGDKLRVFAQSLTLELLIDHANVHLADLVGRYSLERVPDEDLALQIVDHDMGDEVRATSSLSGGETFLVSLGLALGLASLTARRTRIDSLFIDEGFGALDPGSLDVVLGTLDVLRSMGRQVGLISHVPAIAERFATRIEVVATGHARSRVTLIDGLA